MYCCQTCVNKNQRKGVRVFGLETLCQHVASKHSINMQADAGTHDGYVYCNDCPRSNGHGRRLPSFKDVKEHLTVHNVDVCDYDDVEIPDYTHS